MARKRERRRHEDTLRHIETLERDLGLDDGVADTTQDEQREETLRPKKRRMETPEHPLLTLAWKLDPTGAMIPDERRRQVYSSAYAISATQAYYPRVFAPNDALRR